MYDIDTEPKGNNIIYVEGNKNCIRLSGRNNYLNK